MKIDEFLRGIGCLEYEDVFEAYPLTDRIRKVISTDIATFADMGNASDDPGLFFLSSFLQLAYECHRKYEELCIPDDIFFATFRDISIWASWYRRHTGRVGLDRIYWLRHHVNLEVFRLGELEVEIPGYPLEGIWDDLETSAPVLFVHVPEGADLSGAGEFFQRALRFFHYSKAMFLIHTWLLSPQLDQMLSPDSRIRKFSSLFKFLGTSDDHQAEERLFGYISTDAAEYPVTSSLSAKAKSFLMDGGRILSGYGCREEFLSSEFQWA